MYICTLWCVYNSLCECINACVYVCVCVCTYVCLSVYYVVV